MEFNKSKYDQDYMRKNITRKLLAFNKLNPDDMEILAWINSQQNATAYIKQLVREDMDRQKKI